MTILRQRMTEDMQVRNLSLLTQLSYVQQVSLFARHFDKSPSLLGVDEIRSYQIYLTNEKKLSPRSIHVAVSALRFLYRVTLKKDWVFEDIIPTPKAPKKLPIVLSPEEVVLFLNCVESIKHRTILTTCYAAGLRISEVLHLKPAAIDRRRSVDGLRRRDGLWLLDRSRLDRPLDVGNPLYCGSHGHRARHSGRVVEPGPRQRTGDRVVAARQAPLLWRRHLG